MDLLPPGESFATPQTILTSSAFGKDTYLEPEPCHPEGLKLFLIICSMSLSVFLISLPKITDDLRSLDDIGWYGSAYFLAMVATQFLFGRLYTVLSPKKVYIGALCIFELGSLMCGVAPHSNVLISGRAVAGVGAAGTFTGSIIIVTASVPKKRLPMFLGPILAMYGVAGVAGPILGGAITDRLSWRWVFYLNLPIGAFALFIVAVLSESPGARHKPDNIRDWIRLFDLLGNAVFVAAIICLLLALQLGGTKYPWRSSYIITLLVLFVVLLSACLFLQLRKSEPPTLLFRLLKMRSVVAAAWFSFWIGGSFFILAYFLPLWFQAIEGASAMTSGIDNLPTMLGLFIGPPIAGGIVTAFGYYSPFMILASIFMSVGAGLISTFAPGTSDAHWIGYQLIYGLGAGFGLQQPITAVQTILAPEDMPIGVTVVVFMKTLGGAVSVSIAQAIFSNKLQTGLATKVPDVDSSILLTATSFRSSVSPQDLPIVFLVYNTALVAAYRVSAVMACLMFFGGLGMGWKRLGGGDFEESAGAN
ncbi:major facilitator superfamily domain-containing protein [Mycena polygramma]|nr:major facilitator superfamily domain-containing protein [Mycena polygramma]